MTHDIIRPDMILVMDEVGGNTSNKIDGYVGVHLHMFQRGNTVKSNPVPRSAGITINTYLYNQDSLTLARTYIYRAYNHLII